MSTQSPDLPDAAGAFTLSLNQAATALNIAPAELLDLVTGHVACALFVPAHVTTERPPLRFAPGLIAQTAADLAATLPTETVVTGRSNAVIVHAVAKGLRAYLAKVPPVMEYRSKMEEPLLAQDRASKVYAHVKLAVLTRYIYQRGDFLFLADVAKGLELLGAREVRGIRTIGDRRQRWGSWWRLPHTFWSVDHAPTFSMFDLIMGPRLGLDGEKSMDLPS